MSQKDFGAQFGFSRETIAKIERGDQRVYWDLIVPIAIFGNKSLDELAERKDLPASTEPQMVEEPGAIYGPPEEGLIEELVSETDPDRKKQLGEKLVTKFSAMRQEIQSLKDELLKLFRKMG